MRHHSGKCRLGLMRRKEETMAAQSYDRLEGVIWYDGKLVPWHGRQSARAHPRPALRELRVRGRARLWRHDLQEHRAFRAAEALRQHPRLRNSLFGRRDRRRQAAGAREERQEGSLCPPGRLARLGEAGRLGAEQHDPSRHRQLGMAELFRSRRSGSRASGSISPNIAGPIRRPRPASPRPPAST